MTIIEIDYSIFLTNPSIDLGSALPGRPRRSGSHPPEPMPTAVPALNTVVPAQDNYGVLLTSYPQAAALPVEWRPVVARPRSGSAARKILGGAPGRHGQHPTTAVSRP
jgi:hypothetical protein